MTNPVLERIRVVDPNRGAVRAGDGDARAWRGVREGGQAGVLETEGSISIVRTRKHIRQLRKH
jgi:hypothetical protein